MWLNYLKNGGGQFVAARVVEAEESVPEEVVPDVGGP